MLVTAARATTWSDIAHVGLLMQAIDRHIPRWTDASRLQKCVGGKRILFLGDSTTTEHVHMLSLLVTGYSTQYDEQELRSLVERLTHQNSWGAEVHVATKSAKATVRFFPNHRFMDVAWTGTNFNGTFLHRFTGHYDINLDGLGLSFVVFCGFIFNLLFSQV